MIDSEFNDNVLKRRKGRHRESQVKMKPEVGIMLPEAKKGQEPREAARDEEGGRVLL